MFLSLPLPGSRNAGPQVQGRGHSLKRGRTLHTGRGGKSIARATCDQVIREDPAVRSSCVRGRGTETSAEVLVGPPWRMESNAGQRVHYEYP